MEREKSCAREGQELAQPFPLTSRKQSCGEDRIWIWDLGDLENCKLPRTDPPKTVEKPIPDIAHTPCFIAVALILLAWFCGVVFFLTSLKFTWCPDIYWQRSSEPLRKWVQEWPRCSTKYVDQGKKKCGAT